MTIHFKSLTLEKWSQYTLKEQMGNIGSDVTRAIRHKNKGETAEQQAAFERALELFYLTVEDPKNRTKLKEICRARELFIDFLVGDNVYRSTDENTMRYFDLFAYAARKDR